MRFTDKAITNEIHCFSSLRKSTEHAGGRLFIMASSALTAQNQAVESSAQGTVENNYRWLSRLSDIQQSPMAIRWLHRFLAQL